MLDTLTDANSRDFNARYAGTFGWLQWDGKSRLVHIVDVTERDVIYRLTDKGMDMNIVRNSGVQFEFTQIDRGFYNGSDGVVYHLARVPARQWKRGICRGNTNINSLSSGLFNDVKMTVDKLKIILANKDNYNWHKDAVVNETALSRHFAISGQMVYFHRVDIGVLKNTNSIKLNSRGETVKQELQDTLNRTGWNQWLTLTQ